jgi:hypothetical protein
MARPCPHHRNDVGCELTHRTVGPDNINWCLMEPKPTSDHFRATALAGLPPLGMGYLATYQMARVGPAIVVPNRRLANAENRGCHWRWIRTVMLKKVCGSTRHTPNTRAGACPTYAHPVVTQVAAEWIGATSSALVRRPPLLDRARELGLRTLIALGRFSQCLGPRIRATGGEDAR